MSQAAIGKKARRSRSIVPEPPSVEKESGTRNVTGLVAAAFTPAEVSIGVVENGWVTGAITREDHMTPANPQCYRRDDLRTAFQYADEHDLLDPSIWELPGRIQVRVRIVLGEATNVKISTPLDWEIAQRVILPRI